MKCLSQYSNRLWAEHLGFIPGRGKVLLFSIALRPASGPTQPLIQWLEGSLSLVVKLPVDEADHSAASSAEAKNGAYAIRLHGLVHRNNSTFLPKFDHRTDDRL